MKSLKNQRKWLYYSILFLFFLLLSICTSSIYLRDSYPLSSDLMFSLNRITFVKDNILKGLWLYPIYTTAIYNYGYIAPCFYPDIFLYIPAILNALGLNIVHSYGIFTIIINLSTFVSVYYIGVKLFKNEYKAISISLIYTLFYYKLQVLYVWGRTGESLVYLFIPWVFYSIYCCYYKKEFDKWIIIALSMSGIAYSHIISLAIISITLVIFAIINFKRTFSKELILPLLKAVMVFTGLSAYILIPMVEMMLFQDYVYNLGSPFGLLKNGTVKFLFKYSSFEIYPTDILTVSDYLKDSIVLIIYILIVYMSYRLLRYIKAKKSIKSYIIALTGALSFIIYITATDMFPWILLEKIFPFMNVIQFPWRILILLVLPCSIFISYLFECRYIKPIAIPIMLLVHLFIVIPLFQNSDELKGINEIIDNGYIGMAEYLPIETNISNNNEIGMNLPYIINKNRDITVLKGSVLEVSCLNENNNYKIEKDDKSVSLELPLFYYKGYEIKVNDIKIEYYKSNNGLIAIDLDSNENILEINIVYKRTLLHILSIVISIFLLISSLKFLCYYNNYNKRY